MTGNQRAIKQGGKAPKSQYGSSVATNSCKITNSVPVNFDHTRGTNPKGK